MRGLAWLALPLAALAQTFTACNPLNSTCPADPALGTSHTFNLTNNKLGKTWTETSGQVDYSDPSGGRFIINRRGDSPTIKSDFYIFFGEVHVNMQSAHGTGIISSVVLESDDLDEVDWEWIGGNNSYVETNYFGKGNTTTYDRAIYYPVATPDDQFHDYGFKWTKDKIDWTVDGAVVRTLAYADALGGANYPQTPMTVRLGIWAGGDASMPQGTIEWAGGKTDYNNGPYTMTVKSITVIDYSGGDGPVAGATTNTTTAAPAKRDDNLNLPAKSYTYSGNSGTWQSIKVERGNSTAATAIHKDQQSGQTLLQRWNGLSTGAKIGIAVGVISAVVLSLGALIFYCVKQRRRGKKEAQDQDRQWSQENVDLIAQQKEWNANYGQEKVYMQRNSYAAGAGSGGVHFNPNALPQHAQPGFPQQGGYMQQQQQQQYRQQSPYRQY